MMTPELSRIIPRPHDTLEGDDPPPRREWLVTNGLGGYASGTVAGVINRRYQGLLVSSLPAPLGRLVMLNHLLERVRLPDGQVVWLGDEDTVAGRISRTGRATSPSSGSSRACRCAVRVAGAVIEKRVLMPYGRNTVYVTYRRLDDGEAVRLALRPSIQFRGYEASVDSTPAVPYTLTFCEGRYEVSGGPETPPLRLRAYGERAALTLDEKGVRGVPYEMERRRGYPSVGSLYSPGYFRGDLRRGSDVTLVASTQPWETIHTLSPADAAAAEHERRRRLFRSRARRRRPAGGRLVLAADQSSHAAGRAEEAAPHAPPAKKSDRDRRYPVSPTGPRHDDQPRGATLTTRRFREACLHPPDFATTSATG